MKVLIEKVIVKMIPKQVTRVLCQEIVDKRFAPCKAEVVEFSVQERKSTAFTSAYIVKVLLKHCEYKQCSFLLKTLSQGCQSQFQTECSVYNALPLEQTICVSSL